MGELASDGRLACLVCEGLVITVLRLDANGY